MSDHDERVQHVIDDLDPTPADEVAWPVSRRQTLRALAAAGLLGAGAGSASAQSAGGVIADQAVLSNYGSESVSDGWEVTIDDDVFGLTASEETIDLADGAVGEELVTPSGGVASEIVAPDGTVVFDSVDIPDSVVYQWRREEFADSWPPNVGDSDMAVNGLSGTNGLVSSDGVDDFGLADGPQTLAENETFGLAFTIEYEEFNISDFDTYMGNGSAEDNMYSVMCDGDSVTGNIALRMYDGNSNQLRVTTDSSFGDGSTRCVVINKNGNSGSDIDIFVDDMESAVSTSISEDGGFDNSNYSPNTEFAFYAVNEGGSITREVEFGAGVFEFNTQPYTEEERKDFAERRPEV